MTLTKDELEALRAERQDLFAELREPGELREARRRVNEVESKIAEVDPGFATEIGHLKDNIQFLIAEAYDGDRGQEVKDFAVDEVAALEKQIAEIARSRSETLGDIWSQYVPARQAYNDVMVTMQDRTEEIQRRISAIERQLPSYTETLSPAMERWNQTILMENWNEVVRRVEYYARGTDALPDPEAEPWKWDDQRWSDYFDEFYETPPEGLFSDPVEDRDMQIEALNEQIRWLEIELNRENRQSGEFKEETEEYKKSVTRTLVQNNAERFRPSGGWHPNMQENIELLQNMGMEGHSIDVLFNRRDQHVQRDLVLRYGVDVGFATRMSFKVSHYSHMNNYYGQLESHPNTTVLLGLNIDRKNKIHPSSPEMNSFHVKTALRPFDEGERYQFLEFKHAPGGTGFSFYDRKKLMAAHHRIMAELYGKKGPER